jgi:hypothetical protein
MVDGSWRMKSIEMGWMYDKCTIRCNKLKPKRTASGLHQSLTMGHWPPSARCYALIWVAVAPCVTIRFAIEKRRLLATDHGWHE